jgi:hypothetical protein
MMELLNTLNQGNSFFVCLFFGRTEVLNSGFELKTYHLSHTSSPFCSGNFGDGRGGGGLMNYLPRLALNQDPPDLSLPSS